MSRASFPRAEHSLLLQQRIEHRLRVRQIGLEVTARGVDHYRCRYRFGFRRSPGQEWAELSVHFQVAERLEASQQEGELSRILDSFLERAFSIRGPGEGAA